MTGHTNAVNGTVVGTVVQAGIVHGGIHLHPPTREPPRQLIAPPSIFVGRDAELDTLHSTDAALVVLTGPGGVGKTTLARRWAHDISARYPDGQLSVDLHGFSAYSAVDPAEALGMLLRALGVPPEGVPAGVAEQSARFRSLTAGRALLIMLDNAFSAAQVRVLLPGAGPSLVLVTSRRRLAGLVADGAIEVEVRPWSTPESIAMLERVLGSARVSREPAHAALLGRLCGGLPLALSLVAARLAVRPKLPLARLTAELGEEAGRLHGLRSAEGMSVQSSLDLSYGGLEPAVRTVYRRLAVLPAREYGQPAIAAVAGWVEGAIDELLQANLLEEVAVNRFRQHDLLYLHARERFDSDEPESDRDHVRRAGLEWYLAAATAADRAATPYRRRPVSYAFRSRPSDIPEFAGAEEAVRWLDDERAGLLAAGRMALAYGWNELAWHLSDVLWPLFLYRTHRADRIAVDARGATAALRWGNRWAEADMRKRLGDAYAGSGHTAESEEQLRLAADGFRDACDPLGELDAEGRIAALYSDTGRAEKAIEMFTRLLAANRATGVPRRAGLTLIRLGALLVDSAPDAAVGHLLEARAIFRDLVDVDPYNRLRVETALARAYLAKGVYAEATGTATGAAVGLRELGSLYEEAQAVAVLADAARLSGDADGAERHRARVSAIYDGLGLPRPDVVEGEGGAAK